MRNISVLGWVVILVISPLLLRWFLDRLNPKQDLPKRAPLPSQHSILRRKLIAALLGDHAAADRLIAHEMKKRPGTSYCEAAQTALDSLEQDRSRV